MKQFLDRCAYTFTGAVLVAAIWFVHTNYKMATEYGYTPEARAFMDNIVAQYNEPDYESIPRLSISDLE